jgi:hypothetical protein
LETQLSRQGFVLFFEHLDLRLILKELFLVDQLKLGNFTGVLPLQILDNFLLSGFLLFEIVAKPDSEQIFKKVEAVGNNWLRSVKSL